MFTLSYDRPFVSDRGTIVNFVPQKTIVCVHTCSCIILDNRDVIVVVDPDSCYQKHGLLLILITTIQCDPHDVQFVRVDRVEILNCQQKNHSSAITATIRAKTRCDAIR